AAEEELGRRRVVVHGAGHVVSGTRSPVLRTVGSKRARWSCRLPARTELCNLIYVPHSSPSSCFSSWDPCVPTKKTGNGGTTILAGATSSILAVSVRSR